MKARRGVALLEAIAALTVLAIVSLGAVDVVAQAWAAVRRAQERLASMQEAEAFLENVALWPQPDLDRRLGVRAQGAWLLRIEAPSRGLYLVQLLDGDTTVVLTTALIRDDSS